MESYHVVSFLEYNEHKRRIILVLLTGWLIMVRRAHIWSIGPVSTTLPMSAKTKIVIFYCLSNAFDLISGSKFGKDTHREKGIRNQITLNDAFHAGNQFLGRNSP